MGGAVMKSYEDVLMKFENYLTNNANVKAYIIDDKCYVLLSMVPERDNGEYYVASNPDELVNLLKREWIDDWVLRYYPSNRFYTDEEELIQEKFAEAAFHEFMKE